MNTLSLAAAVALAVDVAALVVAGALRWSGHLSEEAFVGLVALVTGSGAVALASRGSGPGQGPPKPTSGLVTLLLLVLPGLVLARRPTMRSLAYAITVAVAFCLSLLAVGACCPTPPNPDPGECRRVPHEDCQDPAVPACDVQFWACDGAAPIPVDCGELLWESDYDCTGSGHPVRHVCCARP